LTLVGVMVGPVEGPLRLHGFLRLEQDMNQDLFSRGSSRAGRDSDVLARLRPARSMALLTGAALFLVIGIRLQELRPLFGGSGFGLVIIVGSFTGAFIAGISVLLRAVRARRATRIPAHREGRKVPALPFILGAVVVLDLMGIVAAAIS
jgi:hypothetical protein